MTVYDIKDSDGRVVAFQVENLGLWRRSACKLAARIPGCRIAKGPRFLSWFREDEFCQFKIGEVTFAIAEPFGDNSLYWVGPQPLRWVPEIALVRQAFIDKPGVSTWVRVGVVLVFVVLLSAMTWGLRRVCR